MNGRKGPGKADASGPRQRELTNRERSGEAGGLHVRTALVNGRPAEAPGGPRGRSARKRREALLERSRKGLPGDR